MKHLFSLITVSDSTFPGNPICKNIFITYCQLKTLLRGKNKIFIIISLGGRNEKCF